jgi:response regulator RpfG family c-di-GMP phosphodiesterase
MERLEILLQSGSAANEPEFKLALTRLAAEISDRLRKDSSTSPQFFSAALRVLSRIKGAGHAETRVKCLLDSGHFLFSNGYNREALEAVRLGRDLATRAKKQRWIRKAETLGGIIHADVGNVAEAVICHSNALTIARDIGDLAGEVIVFLNLGVALIYGGLYREAIPCFERVVALSRTDSIIEAYAKDGGSARDLELSALTNMAQCHLYLDELEQGLAAISLCLSKSAQPHDMASAVSRGIRELTYVRLALGLRRLDDARVHSDLCVKFGRSGGRRGRFHGELSRGLVEVHGGDTRGGIAILEAAMDSHRDVHSLRVDSLEALVLAYEQVGEPERALSYLRKLIDHVRGARERGIGALLSISQYDSTRSFARESDDLRALKSKELELRAKVAENETINARIEVLERLAVVADLKEETSGEHGYRVGKLASLLAEKLGWTKDLCFALDLAARLHDIGKIGMPDRILLQSQHLQEAERHFMSTHTTLGAELLAKGGTPHLRMAEEIARYHHEWWDGTGYPSKLCGKRIPIHARIVALADVFDALTHGRPYATPWPMQRALDEIRSRRGTQFDPELTDRFFALIESLCAQHENLDGYLGMAGRDALFLQARNKIRLMLAEERENERKATVSGNDTRH